MIVLLEPDLAKARFVDRGSRDQYWRSLHRLADRHFRAFSEAVLSRLRQLRQLLPGPALVEAVRRLEDIRVLAPEAFREFTAGLGSDLARRYRTLFRGGHELASGLSRLSAGAVEDATRGAAAMIEGIDRETRRGIRQMTREAVRGDLTEAAFARRLRDRIGLNARQQRAVDRARAAGLPEADVARMIRRKLRDRTETIARTETIRAASLGQRIGWQQMADRGEIDGATARLVWVVTPDDRLCDYCRGMDGQTVALQGGRFTSGAVTLQSGELRQLPGVRVPPLHPRCRCALRLVTN